MDTFVAPLECKFAGDGALGEFEGYGSVFGNVDAHGDKIVPGAFAASLAERKAQGRGLPMHLNHGLPQLGGQRGVGVWTEYAEDGRGLRVKGRISGMNTESGRFLYERVKDGAFPGLSIGFQRTPNGTVYGKTAGDPRRTHKVLHLAEVSLVDDPSNPQALVDGIKAAGLTADSTAASTALAQAMRLVDKHLGGESYAYGGATLKERAQIMNFLRDAYEALTGDRAPSDLVGWKSSITERDVEALLREECGLSHTQARALAERRFKAAPRDEGSEANTEAVAALSGVLSGLTLPTTFR